MLVLNCVAGPSRRTAAAAFRCVRLLSTTPPACSGHNRWSKIRHKKGAADAQRSALFSRLTNEIHQSMRPPNSSDPSSNTRLATALSKARDGGVPKSAIENILARAKAAADGTGQTVIYEAVAAGGKAGLIIECLTDNPTRTVSRVKELLNKNGGRMAPTAYLFEKKGRITLESTASNQTPTVDSLLDVSLDHGVEDVREATVEGDIPSFELITSLSDLANVTTLFSTTPMSEDWVITSSEISYEPVNPLVVGENATEDGISEDKAESMDKLVEVLEVEPDVTQVWTNLSP